MPKPNLPPLPREGQSYREYVESTLPAQLAEVCAAFMRGADDDGLLIEVVLQPFETLISDNRELGLNLLRLLARDENPKVRVLCIWQLEGLLGHGIDEAERILWDELLFDQDADVAGTIWTQLANEVLDQSCGTKFTGSYTDAEIFERIVKLGLARKHKDDLEAGTKPSPA
jgi:hypothetical protein